MPHIAMWREVPGSEEVVSELVASARSAAGGDDTKLPSQEELCDNPVFNDFLDLHVQACHAAGASQEAAMVDGEILASHLFYMISFDLCWRKTFWVDPSLAWMLHNTRIDISGSCLRLPFPCCAFVFTDRETLELGNDLLLQEGISRYKGRSPEILTVFVISAEGDDGSARGVRLFFLLDINAPGWPFMVSRDLFFAAEDDLETILESHFPAVVADELDPLFLTPELKRLVQLVINAVLYTTSAHLDPLRIGEPRNQSGRGNPHQRLLRATRAFSGNDVYYLPGRISISRLRQLRELGRKRGGSTIMKRFMVRGHWRRAPENWKDQRLRWIEPHWKGPEIAPLLEREYRLAP